MKTTDMETVYDLGQKMIESLTKEKVQAGLMSFALTCNTNLSFVDCYGFIITLIFLEIL